MLKRKISKKKRGLDRNMEEAGLQPMVMESFLRR